MVKMVNLNQQIDNISQFLDRVTPKTREDLVYVHKTALRIAKSLRLYRQQEPTGHFAKMFKIGLDRQRAVVIQFEDDQWYGSFELGKKLKDENLVELLKKLLNIN